MLIVYADASWMFGDPYFSFDISLSLLFWYVLRKNKKKKKALC